MIPWQGRVAASMLMLLGAKSCKGGSSCHVALSVVLGHLVCTTLVDVALLETARRAGGQS